MRVFIDLSILTRKVSMGVVSGAMDLDAVPRQGEMFRFGAPKRGVSPIDVDNFPTSVLVERVLRNPDVGPDFVMLSLADVTTASHNDAGKIFTYFRDGFGLHVDRHDSRGKRPASHLGWMSRLWRRAFG